MGERVWNIILHPMHIVVIKAEDMEQHNEVLTFTKGGKRCGQFSQYMGWVEVLEEPKAKASVTPFTVVPIVQPAREPGWDGNGSPVEDTPPPAAVLPFPFQFLERP